MNNPRGYRDTIYRVFKEEKYGKIQIGWFPKAIEILILLNVLAVVMETFESVDSKYSAFFEYFEIFTVTIFSVELLMRIWIADLLYPSTSKIKSIIKLITSPEGIVDIIAIAPFFIPFMFEIDLRHIRVLRLARLLRVFRVQKYNHSLKLITKILNEKKIELLGTLLIASTILVVSSTLMFYLERNAQPDKFPNIINAFWWGIITLTTIGYGDITPITGLGKLLAGIVAVSGVLLMAIPLGIISTGFVQKLEEHNRRKRMIFIRTTIKDAFNFKYIPEINCEVRRGALSMEAIRINLEIADDEIVFIAEGKNEFRYRRLHMMEKGVQVNKLCLEYRDTNTEYGIYNPRPNSFAIISPESFNKQSIGYMAYCLSEMLKCTFMSNEFFGDEAETRDETFGDKGLDSEATYNFTDNLHYIGRGTDNMPAAFEDWKSDLKKSIINGKCFVIVDSHDEKEHEDTILFKTYKNDIRHSLKRDDIFIDSMRESLKNHHIDYYNIQQIDVLPDGHIFNYGSNYNMDTGIFISIPQQLLITGIFRITATIGEGISLYSANQYMNNKNSN